MSNKSDFIGFIFGLALLIAAITIPLSISLLIYRDVYNHLVIRHLQDRGPLFHYGQNIYVKDGFYRGAFGKIVETDLEDYGTHSDKKPEYFYYVYDDKIKRSLKLRESDLEPIDKNDEYCKPE